jgi:hypothetical protein
MRADCEIVSPRDGGGWWSAWGANFSIADYYWREAIEDGGYRKPPYRIVAHRKRIAPSAEENAA